LFRRNARRGEYADPRLVARNDLRLYEPGSRKAILSALVAVGVPAIRFMTEPCETPAATIGPLEFRAQ